jgi:hypothetical protein
MATNYPIVRLRNIATGHIFYCRTSNHSTLAVNTGSVIHRTQFSVPANAELGAADITVVANGIASDPVRVTVSWFKKIEVKELKIEIKELDIAAGPGALTSGADTDLLSVVRMLAERADKAAAEAENGGKPFIQEHERPRVGEAVVGVSFPASNPIKKEPEVKREAEAQSDGVGPLLPPSSPNKGHR